jgi:hypothetical protein
MKTPTHLSVVITGLKTELPRLLGRNLVGIYLYGSVTNTSFNPKRSDVDCLVVTERDLTDTQFRKLKRWLERTAKLNPWTTRLQMLFVIKSKLLTMNAKATLYQFGVLKRTGWDGNPIIWLDYMRSGKILLGPAPQSFLPEITREVFFEALNRELNYLREEISENPESEWRDVPMYRAYAVLTVCRILYSVNKDEIVSKPTAAKWAIKNLPKRWHRIIRQALDLNESRRETEISLERIDRFLTFADSRLQSGSQSVP